MLKILKHLNVKEWVFVGISVIFTVASVWLDLRMPEYMSAITRLVQTEGSKINDIWINGGYMLLCALGSLTAAVAVGFFASQVAASLARRLRSLLFDKVDSFSMGEINTFSTASLITRSTNDTAQVQMVFTMGFQMLVKAPILAVWAVIKISGKGMQWTAATGIAVVILLVMFLLIMVLVLPKFRKMQEMTDDINRITRENLTGLPVVRAYNAEDYERIKFKKANDKLTDTQLFTSRAMSFVFPVMNLIMSGLALSVYWIGAALIKNAAAGERLVLFSNMVVFSSYSMQVIMAFMMITMLFIILPRAQISAKRINEVISSKPSVIGGDFDGQASEQGTVEFKNVCFQYPGAADYVLKDISFCVNKGETVAFIGSTGSGKSTLTNLIPRFYDATSGEVLVDGVNVKEYKLQELYKKIGYIPQRSVMFSGTVTSNVAFGAQSADDKAVEDAVKIAQGREFVEQMPNKYQSPIARGGTNISGGQKQRLAIARAVYKKPEIYIFDDSFSALDYRTDRKLRTVLKKQLKEATILIVAQRIGTIMDADKIVVLDEGRLAGIGTHSRLLEECKVYREIASSQLSTEELKI